MVADVGTVSTSAPIGTIDSVGPPCTTYAFSPTKRTAKSAKDKATMVVVTATATTVANACAAPRTERSAPRRDTSASPALPPPPVTVESALSDSGNNDAIAESVRTTDSVRTSPGRYSANEPDPHYRSARIHRR